MAKFEVHIPAPEEGGFNVTLKVDADNWMAALKAGMQRLGEQGSAVQNLMVDMQDDNSIHVTEPRSNRVFRIRELSEEEAARAPVKRPTSQIRPPSVPPRAPADESSLRKTLVGAPPMDLRLDKTLEKTADPLAEKTLAGPPKEKQREVDTDQTPVPDDPELKEAAKQALKPTPAAGVPVKTVTDEKKKAKPVAKARPPAHKSAPRLVEDLEHPTLPVNKPIGRQRPKSSPGLKVPPAEANIEDMLADVFERVQDIHGKKSIDDALYFVLDLALEKVPADAGSVFHADGATGDLTFLAARGPRAKELLSGKIVVPAGEGIAGFCATEGVSVAVSDVQRDPRYFAEVAEKVDYETKSVVCSPMMTHGRSFGCIQLINRAGGPHFAEHEVGLVSYLAHQAALYLNNYG